MIARYEVFEGKSALEIDGLLNNNNITSDDDKTGAVLQNILSTKFAVINSENMEALAGGNINEDKNMISQSEISNALNLSKIMFESLSNAE